MAKNKNDKAPAKEKFLLHVQYSYSETGCGVCEGQEDDAWPSYNDSYRTYTYGFAFKKVPESMLWSSSYETVEVTKDVFDNAKDVFAPIVVYSTGDTFSHTEGMNEVLGAFATYQEAEKELELQLDSSSGYKPWNGYFESFTDKKIVCVKVV